MKWENELKRNIRTIERLKKYLKLSKKEEKLLKKVIEIHPMSITRYYLSLINKSDKKDPIRKMMIPSEQELDLEGSYDTSGEKSNTKQEGLQHKYQQTALILLTQRCTAYCRFCFRKRLVGLPNKEILHRFNRAIKYIKSHNEINNVLISGGDPLKLQTKIIEKILSQLSSINHIKFIRIGTRVPVVFPDRILEDKSLLKTLKKYSHKDRRIYIVTHFNHPNEITPKAISAINKLIESNIIINNQTVLMKDVNNNPEVLAELLNKLVSIGINPYYVFQCRPVKRVKKYFQIPLYKGYKIIEDTKKQLNGHSKRFKYIMAHRTGKIEILGILKNEIYLKYHQAKNPKNIGKFLIKNLNKKATWLDDL